MYFFQQSRNLLYIKNIAWQRCLSWLLLNLCTQQAQKVIEKHDPSKPLFLYLPFQNVHFPVQAPQRYIDKYGFINDTTRKTYAAMLDIVDEAIGNVTKSLEKAG